MTPTQIQNKAKAYLHDYWSNNKTIKGYRVAKMSYGDYFLEPRTWQGGERDGFSSKTLWISQSPLLDNEISYAQFVDLIENAI